MITYRLLRPRHIALMPVMCFMLLMSAYAAGADTVKDLQTLAHTQYDNNDFDNYVITNQKIRTLQPGFSPEYNIALGLYRAGHFKDASTQLNATRDKFKLSKEEQQKVTALDQALAPKLAAEPKPPVDPKLAVVTKKEFVTTVMKKNLLSDFKVEGKTKP